MSKVESRKISMVKNRPVQDPCFRMSETFAKLTKNFPENKVRNPCPKIYRNFRNILKLSKMIKNFENQRSPSKGYTRRAYDGRRVYDRRRVYDVNEVLGDRVKTKPNDPKIRSELL